MTDAPVVLWFRNDLRLADHAALHAATETGRPVLPVFVLDDRSPGAWAMGGASRWWLHHSLGALRQSLAELGAGLILRRGDSVAVITEIAEQTRAAEVFTGGSGDPWVGGWTSRGGCGRRTAASVADDDTVPSGLHPHQDRWRLWCIHAVCQWCLALGRPKAAIPAPKALPAAKPVRSDRLEDWDLLPTRPDWAAGCAPPGRRARRPRGRAGGPSCGAGLAVSTGRNLPGQDLTSMLSPHLHWGEISPYSLWHWRHRKPPGGAEHFYRRTDLARFFRLPALAHPHLPERPLRASSKAALAQRHGGPARLAARAHRRADRRCRHAAALADRMDAQPRAHDRGQLPGQTFADRGGTVRPGSWIRWWMPIWRPIAAIGNGSPEPASTPAVLPRVQPGAAGRKFDAEGAYVRRYVPELAACRMNSCTRRGARRTIFCTTPA